MPIRIFAYTRIYLNICMRRLEEINDPSDLIFVLINTNVSGYDVMFYDIDIMYGVFMFIPVDSYGANVPMYEEIWAAFFPDDLVPFLLKHADSVLARITYPELCEARDIIMGVADYGDLPGLLTALYRSPYGMRAWAQAFATEAAVHRLNKYK